jgi:hypothetical protein
MKTAIEKIKCNDGYFLWVKINELISHVTELEKEVERVKNHIIAVNSNHLMEWHIGEPKQEKGVTHEKTKK